MDITGELGYDGPLYDGFLHMTDNMLGPSPMHIKYLSYVYDGFCIWRTNFPGPIESVISKFTCSVIFVVMVTLIWTCNHGYIETMRIIEYTSIVYNHDLWVCTMYNLQLTLFYSECQITLDLGWPSFREQKIHIRNSLNEISQLQIITVIGIHSTIMLLYNWYFLQAFNFRCFRTPHDSTKITSFK